MPSVPENLPQRISEVDRDVTVERLQEAFAEGHITQEEMDARLHVALTAETPGELTSAVAALPARDVGPTVIVDTVGGLIRRRGGWQVPQVFKVRSSMGKVYLDLSRAVIRHRVVDIELHLDYGWAWIVVPREATVDYEGLTAGWKQPAYKAPPRGGSDGPRIRISGTMGYGRLRIRHRRG
ncbi:MULTISPECIES: DUF1707 domain-containing protein [unclassified Streptomyces]|uniref:DUF1707 SHOCT-like domain-containing protein n=1 Tax=unclassified Streptomyces TaxID=2593676 RepID=UPI002965E71F|nr:DUF1707 domain-containing protein [Streptomyces sp. SJL17-1]